MLSAVARHSRDIDEAEIRLVHEPRRVQRIFTRRAPQALVSERSHGAMSRSVAGLRRLRKLGVDTNSRKAR